MNESKSLMVIPQPKKKEETKLEKLKANLKVKQQEIKEYHQLQNEIGKLVDEWKEVMYLTGNKNLGMHTYTLKDIEKKPYGWICRIYTPWSLVLENLEKLTPYIENGLKCIFSFKIAEHKQFALAKIIYPLQVKCNEIPFVPHKVKPYELCPGVDVAGEPIIFNINITPHCLIAGATRSGKNGALDHILTSLIYSCSEKEIELYLLQCAKNDLLKYADCKQVKCFVMNDLEKMAHALEYLMKEIERRLKLMEDMFKCLKGDNLYDYNKLNPKKKLPYTFVIIDEIMVLKLKSRDKKIQEYKDIILDYIERLAEFGGSVGITYITCHQKPEKELLPTIIKNMSLIRICFGFQDAVCSEIVLGNDLAVGLPPRRAYYTTDGGFNLLYTTNLRKDNGESRIKDYIKYSIDPYHKTIFDETNFKSTPNPLPTSEKSGGKTETTPIQPQLQLPSQSFEKISNTKTTEEILKENMAKIPGWVPWNPSDPSKIIDKTNEAIKPSPLTSKKGGKTPC